MFENDDPTLILPANYSAQIADNTETPLNSTKSEDKVFLECQPKSCWRSSALPPNVLLEVAESRTLGDRCLKQRGVLAFPVSEMTSYKARKEPTSDIFAFSCQKCGFSFVIQADFLLTSDLGGYFTRFSGTMVSPTYRRCSKPLRASGAMKI